MFRTIVSILVLMALAITGAEGAVLAGIEGAVSVDRGGSVILASEGAPLAPGDSVRTGEGTARIVYENGCAVQVGPHQAVAVAYAPLPCQTAASGPAFDISFEEIAVAGTAIALFVVLVFIAPRFSNPGTGH